MAATLDNISETLQLGSFLSELKAKDVLILDVSQECSWTNTMALATYTSKGHLKGLIQELDAWANMHKLKGIQRLNKKLMNDWILIDWDDLVIHLFSPDARSYYELEKLWFKATQLYAS